MSSEVEMGHALSGARVGMAPMAKRAWVASVLTSNSKLAGGMAPGVPPRAWLPGAGLDLACSARRCFSAWAWAFQSGIDLDLGGLFFACHDGCSLQLGRGLGGLNSIRRVPPGRRPRRRSSSATGPAAIIRLASFRKDCGCLIPAANTAAR